MNKFEKHKWGQNLKPNIFFLRLVGMWPNDNSYKLDLYLLYSFLTIALFLCMDVLSQVLKLFHLNSLEEFSKLVYLLLTKLGALCKVLCLLQNIAALKRLIQGLDDDVFQPKTAAQAGIVERNIRMCRGFYKTFGGMCAVPVPGESWGILSCTYVALFNVNIDSSIAALNMFLGSQFDIVIDNLQGFKGLQADLVHCVKWHRRICQFAEQNNNFFSKIVLIQFCISAISLGFSMFQLAVLPALSVEFGGMIFYTFAILIQIFMYCWFGNEIVEKSNKLSYAVFETSWVEFEPEIKRGLLLFTLNCQRPLKVSALGVFDLSLVTFLKILKTSWSYFALLLQLNT